MARVLGELAELVGGTLRGDATRMIERAMPLGLAGPGDITFFDSSERSKKVAETCTAAAALILNDCDLREIILGNVAVVEVVNVHEAFTKIVREFRPPRVQKRIGISPLARISPTARIADGVDIHPGATIDDDVEIGSGSEIFPGVYIGPGCRIGRDVKVFPNAVLYENVFVGDRCLLHAAVVLGAYGFGYRQTGGRHVLTQQLGYVEIGNDVEIGAGSTIDRGTYGPTVIGEGTKIDDQVMVGHNCQIGRHNLICGQVGLAGSTTTGDYVVMAGQVGVRDHMHIGDRAVLCAKAGVMADVAAGDSVMGYPAQPIREWRLQQAVVLKLPDLRHELKQLERRFHELQAQINRQQAATSDCDSRAA